jgi:hypothetical protein
VQDKPTFKQQVQALGFNILNKFFTFSNALIKYPFIIILVILALAIAIFILMINRKANVGGLLGRVTSFFGKQPTQVEQANTIPSSRQQALGEADQRGFVQHKVDELVTSKNPFRDKTIVKLPSGKQVKLPSGLKDTDIDVVIETDSKTQIIPKDENFIKAQDTRKAIEQAESTNQKAKDILLRLKAKQ